MFEIVKNFIDKEKLISDNDTIIAGVSGGADSICLLCVLSKIRDLNIYKNLSIRVVHINHSLRETALRDQNFTEEICKKLNVPFYSVTVNVKDYVEKNHLSTEEAARILRYKAFDDIAEKFSVKNYKIAVAHNMDDNAETMLFNMIRGTGIKGLAGIISKRDNIIRPLLCVSRADIENYLKENNMDFCIDETNLQDEYSRNKIRHYIKPVCEEINENYLKRFFELSKQLTEAEDYLNTETLSCLEEAVIQDNENCFHISKEKIYKYHKYLQKRLLLETIGKVANAKKDITATHIEILLELFDNQVGRTINLPYSLLATREYAGIRLEKYNDTNKSEKVVNDDIGEIELEISGITSFDNSYQFETRIIEKMDADLKDILPKDSKFVKWFDYDKIIGVVSLRYKAAGDYICINETGSTKTLKKLFVDEKIPAEMRAKIPIVSVNSNVVWLVGVRASSAFKVTKDTKRILEIKYIKNNI